MANEEKNLPGAQAKGNVAKRTNEKPKLGERIKKWFREMRSELKKVVWPTPKQLVNNTGVSLVVMAGSAVVLWAFDFIADQGVQLLLKIGG